MITTLLDRRSGDRVNIKPEVESKDNKDHNPELEAACAKLLAAIEAKSVLGIRDASREIHQAVDQEAHYEGPHLNDEESEE